MKRILGALLLAAAALGGACGGKVAAEGGAGGTGASGTGASGTGDCTAGETYAEPGCGDAPSEAVVITAAGCYPSCSTEGAPCVAGGGCQKAWVNPCICMAGMGCCDACGGEQLLCLP